MTAYIIVAAVLAADPAGSSPGFRGRGDSLTTASLPLTWNEKENVASARSLAWQRAVEPVIWGNAVFVTTVDGDTAERLIVQCHDLQTGERRWQREFATSTKTPSSDMVSRGAPTPSVDGNALYVFFESGDFMALDHGGKTLWQRSLVNDFGPIQGNHGLGTSVVLAGDLAVLLVDHSGPSYLLACDKATGKTAWKIDREPRVSWTTPVCVPTGNAGDIIVSSNKLVECFAARDGSRRWFLEGIEGNTVASATVAGDTVLVASSAPKQSRVLRLGGSGDVGASHLVCEMEEATSSFGSPLVMGERGYFVNKAGVAYAVDLKTGKTLWTLRLPDTCWASPVGAGERVYFFTKSGATLVFKDGAEAVKLAENLLPAADRVDGVAAVKDAFVIRTGSELVCVGAREIETERTSHHLG